MKTILEVIALLALTLFTLWASGDITFAVTLVVISGAHAFGHYEVARRHQVTCRGPFFVPFRVPLGTLGAFLRFDWPIASRQALIRIFFAGPLAGLAMSILAIVVGLLMSEVADSGNDMLSFEFGTSVLAWLLKRAVLGEVPEAQDVVLSPIGFAGWWGLTLNALHLVPVGRFDGGRILTAVMGYRRFRILSFVVLALLCVNSLLTGAMPLLALVGLATHWRLADQYVGLEAEPLPPKTSRTAVVLFIVLLALVFPWRPANFAVL